MELEVSTEGGAAMPESNDLKDNKLSNVEVEDIEDVFAGLHAGEYDEGNQEIDLNDYRYGSPLYRLAVFRIWLLPKPIWVKILVWLMVVTLVCLLIAVAVSLFYVIAGLVNLAALGWIASFSKK